jgi:hypothetical protein
MTDLDHKRLAKELDRRRMRRRLLALTTLLAAAIAAAMYLRCGSGFGTGGKGPGEGGTTKTVTTSDAAVRCQLRLTATGITVDGKAATREEAIAACKSKTGADVLITGDSRQGDWDELRGALDRNGAFYNNFIDSGVGPRWRLRRPVPIDLLVGGHVGSYLDLPTVDSMPGRKDYADFRVLVTTYVEID